MLETSPNGPWEAGFSGRAGAPGSEVNSWQKAPNSKARELAIPCLASQRCIIPEFNPGSGAPWISQNSGRVVVMRNSGETQKALRGPRNPGVLSPYPFTTGKAALILFSQTEDLQARREGSTRAKVTSPPWSPEIRDGWAGSGSEQGTLSKEPPSTSPRMNSENPQGVRKEANHLPPARELQTTPSTEWMWTMARTQKALWKPRRLPMRPH